MRPSGVESIKAIQAALAEVIVPELTSAFARDVAGTVHMLLESIAAEWDSAADQLCLDNDELRSLLSEARDLLNAAVIGNESVSSIVSEIEVLLHEKQGDSLTLTSLAFRNNALRVTLEHTLVALEDVARVSDNEALDAARRRIYAHLRRVATRGWSFWDASSFRQRMEAIRSAAAEDDASAVVR